MRAVTGYALQELLAGVKNAQGLCSALELYFSESAAAGALQRAAYRTSESLGSAGGHQAARTGSRWGWACPASAQQALHAWTFSQPCSTSASQSSLTVPPACANGWRLFSSSSSGGGGGSSQGKGGSGDINEPDRHVNWAKKLVEELRASRARSSASQYQRKKEALEKGEEWVVKAERDSAFESPDAAASHAGMGSKTSPPATAASTAADPGPPPLLDDQIEHQPGMIHATSGWELLVESSIQRSIEQGALNNLKGAGKPLPTEDHTAQFFRVDPLTSAVTRAMGAQNVRPPSLDARDDYARARQAFEAAVKTAAAKGGAGRVRSGRDAGVMVHWQALLAARKGFNDACLTDKECYGAAWPLNPLPQLVYEKEVEEVLGGKA